MSSQSPPIADVSASLMVAAVRRTTSIKSTSREASWNHYTLGRLSRDSTKLELSFRQSWYAKASEKVEVEVSPVCSVGPTVKRLSQFRNPARLLRENGRTTEYVERPNGLDEEKNGSEVAACPRMITSISGDETQGKDVQALGSHAYNLPNSKFCVVKSGVLDAESEPKIDNPSRQSSKNPIQSDPSSAQIDLEDRDDNASISQSSTHPESTEASFSLPFSREEDERIPSPESFTTAQDWEIVNCDDPCREQTSTGKAPVECGAVGRRKLRKETKVQQAGKSKKWYSKAKDHLKSFAPSGKLANALKKARPTSPHAEFSEYLNTHIMQAKMRRYSTQIL